MPAPSPRGQPSSIDLAAPSPEPARSRRRYHFGSPGFVYVFITLLIALGAFNSQNNLLFWAFGFSLATLIVSGLLSGAMLLGVSVTRDHIADAHAGGHLTIRYRVRNHNRFVPAFALTIEEHHQVEPASARSRRRRAAPPSDSVPTPVDEPRAFVTHVPPKSTVTVEARVPANRRGLVVLRSFTIHTAFPFGIMRKSVEVHAPATTVILPALAAVDPGILDATASRGDAARTSRYRGSGDEFHSLRDYTPGDSPRAIAWKASARRGHLLIKQSLAPAPRRAWLVLRLRVSATQTDGCDERAISMAASMLRHAKERGIAMGLAAPLTGLSIPPRSDPAHYDRLMRELGQIDLGVPDLRGRHAPFPLAAANFRDACLCIHAGSADPTYGPSGPVTHIGVYGETDISAGAPSRPPLSTGRRAGPPAGRAGVIT